MKDGICGSNAQGMALHVVQTPTARAREPQFRVEIMINSLTNNSPD